MSKIIKNSFNKKDTNKKFNILPLANTSFPGAKSNSYGKPFIPTIAPALHPDFNI